MALVPAVSMVSIAPQLAAPTARKVPRVPGEKLAIAEPSASRASDEIGPCPTCGCPLAWESIYRDGVKKCEQCHPAPSRRIVGERWAIVTAGVEVLADGSIQGTPAHSWQPLRDCWRHSKRLRGELAGRTLEEQIVWEAEVAEIRDRARREKLAAAGEPNVGRRSW